MASASLIDMRKLSSGFGAMLTESLMAILALIAAGRFIVQDIGRHVREPLGRTSWYPSMIITSAIFVAMWDHFLYQGVIDPLGGIDSLWPLFGISNQLLAAVALCVGTTIITKMGKVRYTWITLAPLAWVATVTLSAGWIKRIFRNADRVKTFRAMVGLGYNPLGVARRNHLLRSNLLARVITVLFLGVATPHETHGQYRDAIQAGVPVHDRFSASRALPEPSSAIRNRAPLTPLADCEENRTRRYAGAAVGRAIMTGAMGWVLTSVLGGPPEDAAGRRKRRQFTAYSALLGALWGVYDVYRARAGCDTPPSDAAVDRLRASLLGKEALDLERDVEREQARPLLNGPCSAKEYCL
ncbi:MAG: carbon starvation CstA 5TM domain-containing protein [Gemmatimonadaceae bacterium]